MHFGEKEIRNGSWGVVEDSTYVSEHLKTISNWHHQEAFMDILAMKSKLAEIKK